MEFMTSFQREALYVGLDDKGTADDATDDTYALAVKETNTDNWDGQTHVNEQWVVYEGQVDMSTEYNGIVDNVQLTNKSRPYTIEAGVWHKAENTGKDPAYVIEVQQGEKCIEEDIERRD